MKAYFYSLDLLFPALAAGLVAVALWWLYPDSERQQLDVPGLTEGQTAAELAWQQPEVIAEAHPRPISAKQWPISFEVIEAHFLDLAVDETGRFTVNADLATALEQAAMQLPDTTPPDWLQRIETLFRKSFPGPGGEQLASLFGDYYRYRQAREAASAGASSAPGMAENLRAATRAFERSVARQREFFGEATATQMFGRQNALAAYLLARREIREDGTLSEAEKRTRLGNLQETFHEHNLQ